MHMLTVFYFPLWQVYDYVLLMNMYVIWCMLAATTKKEATCFYCDVESC